MGVFRLLLALSVVLTHAGGFYGFQLAGGAFAVLIFFMVSGFLMQLVLTTRYDPVKDLKLFYGNRLLRIFPIYWTALVSALLMSVWLSFYGAGYFALISPQLKSLTLVDAIALAFTHIGIIGSDVVLFLDITPHGLGLASGSTNPPAMQLLINPPAWSLGIELLFYALAPFLARRDVRWTVGLLLAGFTTRLVLIGYTHSLTGLGADRFFPTALPFFLAGMLACRWRDVIVGDRLFMRIAGWGTIGCVFSVSALSLVGAHAGIPAQFFGIGFAAVAFCGIPALFAFSNAQSLPLWMRQWDTELGALSYPVYLVHWQVITAFEAFLPVSAMRTALITVVVLAGAFALTRWIEQPIDRYRNRRRRQLHRRNEAADVSLPNAEEPVPVLT